MKDLFRKADLTGIHKGYNIAVMVTEIHTYLCFIHDDNIDRVGGNHNLGNYLQCSDYVIRDGELLKSKLTVVE